MQDNSDIELVRNAALLHTQAVFALRILALNIGVQPHALEDFIATGKPLPVGAMGLLVATLFSGKARWDDASQSLADVMKPATLAHAARSPA
jgi:hypothetical protein